MDNTTKKQTFRSLARHFKSLGTRWGTLKNIVEAPFFVDSKVSRPMQLADHLAYAVFRRYQYGDASLLDLVAHTFDCETAGAGRALGGKLDILPPRQAQAVVQSMVFC
jgi:hypothetical protein